MMQGGVTNSLQHVRLTIASPTPMGEKTLQGRSAEMSQANCVSCICDRNEGIRTTASDMRALFAHQLCILKSALANSILGVVVLGSDPA